MSSDALSPQQFKYHISRAENRSSIEEHGLDPARANPKVYPMETPSQAKRRTRGSQRVYLTDTPGPYLEGMQRHRFGTDVYQVNTAGLKLRPDDFAEGHTMGSTSYHTRQAIEPERITRITRN